ncbi:MAG: hypothetical protein AAF624_17785 [Bacteroidota bacterium]
MPASTPSNPTASLTPTVEERALDEFVQFWGEMAGHWGINRTMAQIHALLYATAEPLDTDTIMARLQVSRGNANMNLRALVDWRLVDKVSRAGSRKDFYVAETDVWKICTTVIEERKHREIKPVQTTVAGTIATLHADGPPASEAAQTFEKRLHNLADLLRVFDAVTDALLPFVQAKNEKKLRRLAGFAARLHGDGNAKQEGRDSTSATNRSNPTNGTAGSTTNGSTS